MQTAQIFNKNQSLSAFLQASVLLAVALVLFVVGFMVLRQPRNYSPQVTTAAEERLHSSAERLEAELLAAHLRQLRYQADERASASEERRHKRQRLGARDAGLATSGERRLPGGDKSAVGDGAALAVEPQSEDPDFKRAMNLFDEGKTTEAVAALEALLVKDPKNTQAMFELALAYLLDLKKNDVALSYLERVLNIEPKNEEALSAVLDIYEQEGRYDDALNFLRQIDGKHPDQPNVALQMAHVLNAAGRGREAIPYLEKLAQGPDAGNVLSDLAATYAQLGDSEKAVEFFDKSLLNMEQTLRENKAAGAPTQDLEQSMHMVRLEKTYELIKMGDIETARAMLMEMENSHPGDQDVAGMLATLDEKRPAG